ncbi:hypothetical protein [Bradyrhizobium sp.]|jgi:hypothetical protein|uniref:hypothetical protein n=1 Tax=Bradyrhizobium sp. TaxID=376 RepID=UPI002DDD3554|nr:hypothetical protein [Bradyrhizobium sp.]HEV2154365.1 hypothetical protein [Bradyrhizobium sp.]
MKRIRVIGLVLTPPCGTTTGQQSTAIILPNDDGSVLRGFCRDAPKVVQAFPLDQFLKSNPDEPAADIEGTTRIDGQIYGIASHGRNKNGKSRPNQHRPSATAATVPGGNVTPARTRASLLT